MPELYLSENGILFKKHPENALFFNYSRLTDEELIKVKRLLCNYKTKRRKSKAGPFREEPTPDDDARNRHEDGNHGRNLTK